LQNVVNHSPGEVSALEELLRMFLDDGDVGGALDLLAGHGAWFTDRGDFAALERFYLLLREKAPGDMRVLEGLRKVYDSSGETNKLESVVCPMDVSKENVGDGACVTVEEEVSPPVPEKRRPPAPAAHPRNRALTWEEEIDLSMLEEEGIRAFQNADDILPEADSSIPDSPMEEAVAGNVYGEAVVTGIDNLMESVPQPAIETEEMLGEMAPPYPAEPSTESAEFAEIEMELGGPAITDAGWQLEAAGTQPAVEEAAAPPLPSGRKRSKYDLDGQFSEFKKVVDDQLDKDDTETHYNLGIAYKEMCLFDDAINEFQTASIAPLRKIDCLTLQGICYRDKGDYTKAEEIFRETLAMHDLTGGERVSLGYELAFLYEAMGRTEDAVGAYRQVWVESPGFRDVADKIARLHGTDDLPDNAADLELLELEAEEIE
ncbi:MAG TPA: tetratricopeptide repeat protein, partial [Geobacteraceae bacterium]|nr:tetratricopeptide repeat protein [Geobacteraceae bacterium]